MTSRTSQTLTRGKFLQLSSRIALGLAGALGLVGLVRFFSHAPETGEQRIFDLGALDEFPSSGRLLRPDIPAVIYRTPSGFQAFSLICTHLGCTLEDSEGGFSCPCHGSQFDRDGQVLQGPASQRLPELQVEITAEGNLQLHKKEPDK